MNDSNDRWMIKSAPIWSIPFLIPVSTGIGLALGLWLDSKLGTKPWLAIVLTFVGVASGIYEVAKILIEAARENGD